MTNTLEKIGLDEAALATWNEELVEATPQQILEWSIKQFGTKLGLACSFGGISGMALLDMAVRIDPAIHVFYLDTAFLFPETYALRDRAIERYGITPVAYLPRQTPEEQVVEHGEALWKRNPDLCCSLRKVEPNGRALEGLSAWVTGLRRDQSSTRRNIQPVAWDSRFNLYKISPLWAWTEKQVWQYITKEDVPYNELHDQGYPSLGCTNCTRAVAAGEDSRAGRWSESGKVECGLQLGTIEAK